MNVSQKCQYALRALYHLASRHGEGPVPVSEIAQTQAIPPRFLELILVELRQGGFVDSRRGVRGGYLLSLAPADVPVGSIIRFVDGPLTPVKCLGSSSDSRCPLQGNCVFSSLWERAAEAVSEVYDSTSLQDLVERDRAAEQVPNYCI